MFRYMALSWDASNPTISATAERLARRLLNDSPEWHVALHRAGLRVMCRGCRPNANQAYVLHAEQGVVLGKLFHRDTSGYEPRTVATLDSDASARIIASRGQDLVDHYWGRYVAFLRNPDTGGAFILRGPLGTLPCFGATHQQIALCFSWLEDALALGLRPLSLNWDYLAALMPVVTLECRETALNEVWQVLGGERVEVRREVVSGTFLWRPDRLGTTFEQRAEAAAALRDTTRMCVRAWKACYERIVHRLSGGLDSSIVAACLADERQRDDVVCLTYFSPGSDSDEREFARVAANAARRELIERQRDPEIRLERFLDIARMPRPGIYFGNVDATRMDVEVAKARGAGAIFTGAGGDTLYYQFPTDLPAADYARDHGLRPAVFGAAMDGARLGGVSVWSTLGTAIGQGLLRRIVKPSIEERRFSLVPESVIEAAEGSQRFVHPLLKDVSAHPPGKRWHIRCSLIPVQYYDVLGSSDDAEAVHPLLSQPLVELCLRIPSYVLINGGRDRALARQAFSRDLPPLLIRRRSKGGMEEHVKTIMLRNKDFVREMLLDGQLTQRGLLDRRKVEERLSGRPTTLATPLVDLFTHLSVECWLHSWSSQCQKAVA